MVFHLCKLVTVPIILALLILCSTTGSTIAFVSGGHVKPSESCSSSSSRLLFGLSNIEKQENQYLELALNHYGNVPWPASVHIIVYNPNTDLEGVHITEFPRGSGEQALLAFESASECDHFADVIMVGQPGNLADPVPTEYTVDQMIQYCHDMRWSLLLVPDI